MTIETLSVGLVDIKTRKEPGELTGINMYHLLYPGFLMRGFA
jgi:hypothetical protein